MEYLIIFIITVLFAENIFLLWAYRKSLDNSELKEFTDFDSLPSTEI